MFQSSLAVEVVAATHLAIRGSFACIPSKSSLHQHQKISPTTIMLPELLYSLLACFSCALLAKAVGHDNDPTPESHIHDLRLPSHPSSLLPTFNTTPAASVSVDMSIKCDGTEYGFKPDVKDCRMALNRQLFGRTQMKFGQRGSISSESFVHLPYRLMGGT